MRALLLALTTLSLPACLSHDDPTIAIEVLSPTVDAGPNVAIDLRRPFGHTFATVTATIGGVDAGPPSISPGSESSFREPGADASASFYLPLASIERGLHVDVVEGGEHFVVDVPDFNAPRAIHVHTPLVGLRADGWVDLDSGVATDQLAGGVGASVDGGGDCFTQWDQKVVGSTLSLRLPPADTFDECAPLGVTNEPGSTRAVDLSFGLWSTTPVTRCDGPGLTCEPITAPQLTSAMPGTLQF
jgi:hypothetical protein